MYFLESLSKINIPTLSYCVCQPPLFTLKDLSHDKYPVYKKKETPLTNLKRSKEYRTLDKGEYTLR